MLNHRPLLIRGISRRQVTRVLLVGPKVYNTVSLKKTFQKCWKKLKLRGKTVDETSQFEEQCLQNNQFQIHYISQNQQHQEFQTFQELTKSGAPEMQSFKKDPCQKDQELKKSMLKNKGPSTISTRTIFQTETESKKSNHSNLTSHLQS